MARCARCGRGKQYGTLSRHHRGVAGGQWAKRAQKTLKVFKPNLHRAWILVKGKKTRVSLCTKCLRIVKKEQPEKTSKTTASATASL